MNEALDIIHLEKLFLSICESVKLKKQDIYSENTIKIPIIYILAKK